MTNPDLTLRRGRGASRLQGMLMGRLDDLGTELSKAFSMVNSMDPGAADELLQAGSDPTGTLTFALRDMESAVNRINTYLTRAAYAAEVVRAKEKLKLAEERYAAVSGPNEPRST